MDCEKNMSNTLLYYQNLKYSKKKVVAIRLCSFIIQIWSQIMFSLCSIVSETPYLILHLYFPPISLSFNISDTIMWKTITSNNYDWPPGKFCFLQSEISREWVALVVFSAGLTNLLSKLDKFAQGLSSPGCKSIISEIAALSYI